MAAMDTALWDPGESCVRGAARWTVMEPDVGVGIRILSGADPLGRGKSLSGTNPARTEIELPSPPIGLRGDRLFPDDDSIPHLFCYWTQKVGST